MVTPRPELPTLTSASITRAIRLPNLVAYLAAEGTPLQHVLLGWRPILSGQEKGQAGGLGGAEAEEEVGTAILCIYLLHCFLPGIPAQGGLLFHSGPFHFLYLTARSAITPEVPR